MNRQPGKPIAPDILRAMRDNPRAAAAAGMVVVAMVVAVDTGYELGAHPGDASATLIDPVSWIASPLSQGLYDAGLGNHSHRAYQPSPHPSPSSSTPNTPTSLPATGSR